MPEQEGEPDVELAVPDEPVDAAEEVAAVALPGAAVDDGDDELCDRVAQAVLGVPGVLRLEPTLPEALRRLTGRAGAGADLQLQRQGDVVDVNLDLVVEPSLQARRATVEVRRRVTEELGAAGLEAGSVVVGVLAIESRSES